MRPANLRFWTAQDATTALRTFFWLHALAVLQPPPQAERRYE
jgi:hypothetical protein